MSNPIINFVVRGFQFLFAIIVLGLSVSLIRDHHWGNLPATLGFAAFVGGVSIVGALLGIAASWVTFLEGTIGLIIDGLVAIINVAGGILMAIKMKGAQCKDDGSLENANKLVRNDMLNGGCIDKETCYWFSDPDKIVSHCRESQADFVFMFLIAALLAASALLTFLRMRKGY
ncbi:marvel domain-containing protein [Pyrenochaeta sp. MPI-SDFR-AT-0127]|nr:marvel domain-containing protein [Pyrenochaeta sp. MPI-SDFR-AT-0127]